MATSLAWTALVMGLAGGPHCVAMCSAACGGLTALQDGRPQPLVRNLRNESVQSRRTVGFHAGRLAGYTAAGALAAAAVDTLAWTAQHMAALRPVWTLLHVAVLAWGIVLLVAARQPALVDGWGRMAWHRIRPLASGGRGLFVTGGLWALMPCGLLYSALLVAALSGGPLQGALSMALFAVGSGLWLVLGPWLWQHLRSKLDRQRQDWGTRIAGGLLCTVAGWALWMDLAPRIAEWCA